MFQPIRPFVRWSRVLALRANVNGSSWITELVQARPRCSVTAPRAEIITDGSWDGICSPSVTKVSQLPR